MYVCMWNLIYPYNKYDVSPCICMYVCTYICSNVVKQEIKNWSICMYVLCMYVRYIGRGRVGEAADGEGKPIYIHDQRPTEGKTSRKNP